MVSLASVLHIALSVYLTADASVAVAVSVQVKEPAVPVGGIWHSSSIPEVTAANNADPERVPIVTP